eukprot:1219820-Amphidinium_carterae.1
MSPLRADRRSWSGIAGVCGPGVHVSKQSASGDNQLSECQERTHNKQTNSAGCRKSGKDTCV